MRVFVTGATGFIGKVIVKELITAGHDVTGLARSEASEKALIAAGADSFKGDLEDLDRLKKGAAMADGVIHAGFIHDFTRFPQVCEVDRKAIETMGQVLKGTNRPLIVTSGTAMVSPGKMATEDLPAPFNPAWPRASEQAAEQAVSEGVNAAIVRLSPVVHGLEDKHGFIPILFNTAREKGFSAYIGEGLNHWNAVHRLDAARLFRLALENAIPGARYHGAAEGSIDFRSIAEAIGKQLNISVRSVPPDLAADHFGWFAQMAGIDCPASSEITKQQLNWRPSHDSLFTDILNGVYTK